MLIPSCSVIGSHGLFLLSLAAPWGDVHPRCRMKSSQWGLLSFHSLPCFSCDSPLCAVSQDSSGKIKCPLTTPLRCCAKLCVVLHRFFSLLELPSSHAFLPPSLLCILCYFYSRPLMNCFSIGVQRKNSQTDQSPSSGNQPEFPQGGVSSFTFIIVQHS